jgi:hypothetical protein
VNVASENCLISDLHTQPLVHATTTLRAFEDNIILHQSLGAPIVTMASSIKAYTLNLLGTQLIPTKSLALMLSLEPTIWELIPPTNANPLTALLQEINVTPQHRKVN